MSEPVCVVCRGGPFRSGVLFVGYGDNFQSAEWNPKTIHDFLEIGVCDRCLVGLGEMGLVWHINSYNQATRWRMRER